MTTKLLTLIPCLRDNYAYLLPDGNNTAVVVDPGEAEPVIERLRSQNRQLSAILCTHHHGDHVGGVMELKRLWPNVEVVAHPTDAPTIQGVTRTVEHLEEFQLGTLSVKTLHNPGHTAGAATFLVHSAGTQSSVLFTGDTLFLAGCGRLFEGTAAEMCASLHMLAGNFGPNVFVACGHEYTESNLRFACAVEPNRPELAEHAQQVSAVRAQGLATMPAPSLDELVFNPFLRTAESAVRAFVNAPANATDAEVFGLLRAAKDTFR